MIKKNFKLPGHFVKVTHETQVKDVYFGEDLYIKKVIYQEPATIVFWSDDTKTVSKCAAEDTYSREIGLMVCVFKKIYGKDNFRDLMSAWIIPGKRLVELSAVRNILKMKRE